MFAVALILLGCSGPDEPEPSSPPEETVPACADGLPLHPFDAEGPYGTLRGSVAADFTLETRDGPFTLSEIWNGCVQVGLLPDADGSSDPAWPGLWDRDLRRLLTSSPRDVHWLFFTDGDGSKERLDAVEEELDRIIGNLDEDDATFWRDHVHVVDSKASRWDGWPAEKWAQIGYGFLIGRDQRIRDVGSLADPERYDGAVGWFEQNVSYAANEAIYADFGVARDAALDPHADILPLLHGDVAGSAEVVVDFDPTDVDRVEVDLSLGCPGDREFGSCPAWDYLVYLHECGIPTDPDEDWASVTCQPHVAPVTPVVEALGECQRLGVPTGAGCRDVEDCGLAELCVGYVAPVTEVVEVPADTAACACTDPDGSASDPLVRTCRSDGTGYGSCPCRCEELGRWITPYHRGGRWVHDITPLAHFLADPGPDRLRFSTSQPYRVDLDLRKRTTDGVGLPEDLTFLFAGGTFDDDYNDAYETLTLEVPADAVKVELVAVITGHGFGANLDNCAEFCNHTHHFWVNDVEHVKEHPEVDDTGGCVAQTADGTVPNQFGTWFYGRGGWCPGLQVDPWVVDLTDEVTPGQTVSIRYEGRLGGEPYVERPGSGDFQARIDMLSWLAVYR